MVEFIDKSPMQMVMSDSNRAGKNKVHSDRVWSSTWPNEVMVEGVAGFASAIKDSRAALKWGGLSSKPVSARKTGRVVGGVFLRAVGRPPGCLRMIGPDHRPNKSRRRHDLVVFSAVSFKP